MGMTGFGNNPIDLVFDFNAKLGDKFEKDLKNAESKERCTLSSLCLLPEPLITELGLVVFAEPLAHDTTAKLVNDLRDLRFIAKQFATQVSHASSHTVSADGPFPYASIRAGMN